MGSGEIRLPGGVAIHYRQQGEPTAPPMMLLHALGEDGHSWDAFAAEFSTRFFVTDLDLRGHGESSWPGTYSFGLMCDDVLGALDALALDGVVLVGHSMGGIVGYSVAEAQPDRIARLIIEDIVPPVPRVRPLPERPQGPLAVDWAVVVAVAAEINDPSERSWPALARITAPTLLIAGGPTSHIPHDRLERVAATIPDCDLVTIAAGHDVHENEPEAFAALVSDWLR